MRRRPKKGNSRGRDEKKDFKNSGRPDSAGQANDFGSNDPAWYMHNPPLVRDTAMIPFSTPVGKPLNMQFTADFRPDGSAFSTTTATNVAVQPGVFAMQIVPSIGDTTTKGSAANIAAQKIYANIRRTKSGTLPYDAPDVMMYILAMDQLYSFHEWMRRIYGYMNTFSNQNLFVPRAFAINDGVDFDDLMANMSSFRFYINNFALRLSTYLVPQDFDLFKRHAFMYSNLYMDAPVLKAQFYQFVPALFLKFDETSFDTGSALVVKAIDHTTSAKPLTFADIKAFGEELLNAIIYSEDANTMSGDILRGYEASALWKPADTPENYSCVPVYNPEVLEQIHNTTIVDDPKYIKQTADASVKSYIYQDVNEGIIKCRIYRKLGLARRSILDVFTDMPSPAEIMVATRLKVMVDPTVSTGSGDATYYKLVHGSEFVAGAWITSMNSTSAYIRVQVYGEGYTFPLTGGAVVNQLNALRAVTKFQNHPILMWNQAGKNALSGITALSDITFELYGDINNAAPIDYSTLDDLHLVAITSLFGI